MLTRRHLLHIFIVILAILSAIPGRATLSKRSPALGGGVAYADLDIGYIASFVKDRDQYLESPPIPSTTKSAQDGTNSQAPQLVAADELEPNKPQEQRQTIIDYEIVPGDSVAKIASRFGISPETIIWANHLGSGHLISVGETLAILPVDGVLHTAAKGDTLDSLAKRYGVEVAVIANYGPNQLANPDSLAVGQHIIVPGGVYKPPPVEPKASPPAPQPTPAPAPQPKEEGGLAWPTYGMLTQYFGPYHHGIDIAAPIGTPIYAVASGQVIKAVKLEWSYGWYLVIAHDNGFEGLYAHCSQFAVGVGDRVERGEVIAYMGSTGRTTGPHLHFELSLNGQVVNPLNYLP